MKTEKIYEMYGIEIPLPSEYKKKINYNSNYFSCELFEEEFYLNKNMLKISSVKDFISKYVKDYKITGAMVYKAENDYSEDESSQISNIEANVAIEGVGTITHFSRKAFENTKNTTNTFFNKQENKSSLDLLIENLIKKSIIDFEKIKNENHENVSQIDDSKKNNYSLNDYLNIVGTSFVKINQHFYFNKPWSIEKIKTIYKMLTLNQEIISKSERVNLNSSSNPFRNGGVEIVSSSDPSQSAISKGMKSNKIKSSIQDLIEFYNSKSFFNQEIDLSDNIAIFHFLFEYIHPFFDGNGRTGRAITEIMGYELLFRNDLGGVPIFSNNFSKFVYLTKNNYYDSLYYSEVTKDLSFFVCYYNFLLWSIKVLAPYITSSQINEKEKNYITVLFLNINVDQGLTWKDFNKKLNENLSNQRVNIILKELLNKEIIYVSKTKGKIHFYKLNIDKLLEYKH